MKKGKNKVTLKQIDRRLKQLDKKLERVINNYESPKKDPIGFTTEHRQDWNYPYAKRNS